MTNSKAFYGFLFESTPITPELVDQSMMQQDDGIYAIYTTTSQKAYIGSSINIGIRINQHFFNLRNGCHCCKPLQKDFDDFGESSLIAFIVEKCGVLDLNEAEKSWWELSKQKNKLLNSEKFVSRKGVTPKETGRRCKISVNHEEFRLLFADNLACYDLIRQYHPGKTLNGTRFKGREIELRKWFQAIYVACLYKNMDAAMIRDFAEVPYDSAFKMASVVREMVPKPCGLFGFYDTIKSQSIYL